MQSKWQPVQGQELVAWDSGNQTWFQVTWTESTGYQESGLIFKIKTGTRPKNILKNQTQKQITLWNWNWNQNSSNLFFRARPEVLDLFLN